MTHSDSYCGFTRGDRVRFRSGSYDGGYLGTVQDFRPHIHKPIQVRWDSPAKPLWWHNADELLLVSCEAPRPEWRYGFYVGDEVSVCTIGGTVMYGTVAYFLDEKIAVQWESGSVFHYAPDRVNKVHYRPAPKPKPLRTDADIAKEWRDAKTAADCASDIQYALSNELWALGYIRVGNDWTKTKTEIVKI